MEAVRVASAGGYRPASGARISTTAADPSVYDLVSALNSGPDPSVATRPATTIAVRRPAAPATTATTVAVPPPPPPAPAAPPSTAAPALDPLTPLLKTVVPAAAAVLGAASWFDAPDGTCAHRDLPLGTVVKVTRTSTGVSTTCRVADRGPTLATNRIIDLSLGTFEKLASPDAGVIDVRIEW